MDERVFVIIKKICNYSVGLCIGCAGIKKTPAEGKKKENVMEKKNEIQRPDIMIYMSDQHGADYCSWGRTPVDTPVLDEKGWSIF